MDARNIALQIVQAALKAVDPQIAVKRSLQRDQERLICNSQVYQLSSYDRIRVIGFGKGSAPMAQAVYELLADRLADGLVIVKHHHTLPTEVNLAPIQIVEAGHPLPDEAGLKQTKNLIDMLADGSERDLIICLISGGGSALLVQPVESVTLADMQTLTQHLLEAGANITEINTIRKHLSQVKGGWLAKLAAPATIISLILSDVVGDKLDIIASGPTVPDPSTFAEALAILARFGLTEVVPASILTYLQAGANGAQPETPKPGDPAFNRVQNVIIANNQMAVQAATQAARELKLNVASFETFIEGEAREVARKVGSLARHLAQAPDLIYKPATLIFGGETTVTLEQSGLGGRNQEFALASAFQIQDQPQLLIAAVATDGNDGPTDAAGAFVDGQTITRAMAQGLDPQHYLDAHDSYHFFQALHDLIITGPTNTNVNDLILILAW